MQLFRDVESGKPRRFTLRKRQNCRVAQFMMGRYVTHAVVQVPATASWLELPRTKNSAISLRLGLA